MTLLDFTKPKKVDIECGFDGGPTGGYMPQMSGADAERWKAKKFNIGKENARIELRKSFDSVQLFIIIALDGWDLSKKFEKRADQYDEQGNCLYHFDTRGLNVRMSMNGALRMTFEMFDEINQIVNEARVYLTDNA